MDSGTDRDGLRGRGMDGGAERNELLGRQGWTVGQTGMDCGVAVWTVRRNSWADRDG